LNLPLIVRHENFLLPKSGMLSEVSRESVHIYSADVRQSWMRITNG